MGTGSTKNVGNNKLVYAMKVTEVMSIEEYFKDERFKDKIPNNTKDCGDNIYRPLGNGKFLQLPSRHSNKDGSENEESKNGDLKGRKVLISNHFYYFGARASRDKSLDIPAQFSRIKKEGPDHKGRSGHKCNFSDSLVKNFIEWVQTLSPPGVHGSPSQGKSRVIINESITSSCRD